jgi:GTP-binding protein
VGYDEQKTFHGHRNNIFIPGQKIHISFFKRLKRNCSSRWRHLGFCTYRNREKIKGTAYQQAFTGVKAIINSYNLSIEVKGGKGGDGLISFSHLPKQPKGGPDGGDGGKGGDVYLEASEQYHSLEHLQKDVLFKAGNGAQGGKNKKHGKNGEDLILHVPPGTSVCSGNDNKLVEDLVLAGDKIKVAEGGNGGKGNINFATSTNQAPRKATPGKEGETKNLNLIFNPKSDIVVIGPPNSGKSSLIACITGASPEIADYPFTTRNPHLWTHIHEFSRYIFMDTAPLIPESVELIKTLSRRAHILLIVLDCTQLEKDSKTKLILKEIEEYVEEDPRKRIAYVLTKTDKAKELPIFDSMHPFFHVSVKKEEGIEELKKFLFN